MAADRTSRKLPKKGISSTLTGSKISLTNGVTPATGTGKKSKCIGWSGILLEEDIEEQAVHEASDMAPGRAE